MKTNTTKQSTARTAVILAVVFCAWFALDRFTKIYFDSGLFSLGQNISDSILGIFHLTLVHNTGAAFGIFGNSTIVLGIISIVISIFLLALPFLLLVLSNKQNRTKHTSSQHANLQTQTTKQQTNSHSSTSKSTAPQTFFRLTPLMLIAVAIVAAGGIGNAVDRFVTGYVVDFICFDFIDFPVFNIADIGVTCGVLVLVTLMLYYNSKRP